MLAVKYAGYDISHLQGVITQATCLLLSEINVATHSAESSLTRLISWQPASLSLRTEKSARDCADSWYALRETRDSLRALSFTARLYSSLLQHTLTEHNVLKLSGLESAGLASAFVRTGVCLDAVRYVLRDATCAELIDADQYSVPLVASVIAPESPAVFVALVAQCPDAKVSEISSVASRLTSC